MDKEWRLDDLENAMSAIDDAIEALKVLGHSDRDLADFYDFKNNLKEEADEINAELDAEAAADQAALEREYWAMVL